MRVILDLEENILIKLSERAVIEKRSRKNLMEFILENSVIQKDYSNKIEDLKFTKPTELEESKLIFAKSRRHGNQGRNIMDDKLLNLNIPYTKTTHESYRGMPITEPNQYDELVQYPIEPIKDYSYYEKKGKAVGFDEAEDFIREVLNSPNLKSWQKPMLQKMINSRFF